ncbi:MAG: putative porin [Desulfobulbaceae bacterium]
MKRRMAMVLSLAACPVLFSGTPCLADKVDLLIEKLVDKNILTRSEATEMLQAIEAEAAKEAAEPAVTPEGGGVPEWVSKIKLKGDMKVRYEHIDTDEKVDRDRGRFRLRLGAEAAVTDSVKVGFGLASGGSNPRTTIQSFSDTFSSKDVSIDYAYASYQPFDEMTLTGGKMKNPLWLPGDLLWDTDINPEGAAARFSWKFGSALELFVTPMFFVLDELSSTSSDPVMYAVQPGVRQKITDNIDLTLAVAAYGFSNVKGSVLDYSSGSNTLSGDGLLYDYDSIGVGAELGFTEVGFLPYFAFFGEYINNPDPDDENEGYLAGLKFGHKKVAAFGQWQVKYSYRHIETDSWLDIFPDSAFFGGATNAKGHEGIFIFGLNKYVDLTVDYYATEEIEGDISQNVLQMDVNVKF